MKAFQSAVDAVDPETSVRKNLSVHDSTVLFRDEPIDFEGAVRVAALGKAAPAMARGVVSILGSRVKQGVVVTDRVDSVPEDFRLIVGEHPFPGPNSLIGGNALLDLAGDGSKDDLLVVLLSGGGSSLAEVPISGVDIDHLASLNRALMAAATPIEELNCVRRHLSRIKNGRLLEASDARAIVTLLISDVVDAPASTIASGPTLRDASTREQALEILKSRLGRQTPRAITRALGFQTERPERRAFPHKWSVIADGARASHAASSAFGLEGLQASVVSTALRGEAQTAARIAIRDAGAGISILSGETTVSGAVAGHGGRNQEAALSAAIEIHGLDGWVFAALGTDGIDGPTDAAGAIVDARTIPNGWAAGLNACDYLGRHDSYRYLEATGDLIKTGATGTNVGDLWFVFNPNSV